MKTILLFSLLFCVIAMPLHAELSESDLNQIRLIVVDSEKRLTTPMNTLETNGAIRDTEIKNLNETMNTGFDNVQKNFDRQNNIIIACIGIPMGILVIGATVWGILVHLRGRKDRSLETQIEVLTQEIETLKQQRIVQP